MGDVKRGPKPKDRSLSTPSRGIPDPPPNLDADSRKHYRRLTGLMAEAGLVSQLDFDALSLYMSMWKRWKRAEAEVRKSGLVIKAPNGWLQKNPWLEIATQSIRDMRPFLTMFGLTPASRSKLSLPESEEDDAKWSDLG